MKKISRVVVLIVLLFWLLLSYKNEPQEAQTFETGLHDPEIIHVQNDQLTKNALSFNGSSLQRLELVEMTLSVENHVVETKFLAEAFNDHDIVVPVSFSYEIGDRIKGVAIDNAFSYDEIINFKDLFEQDYNIPGTEIKADGTYYSAVIWGFVESYTFDVYDAVSNQKINTIVKNIFKASDITTFAQSNNRGTKDGTILVENVTGTKYKIFNSQDDFEKGFGMDQSSHLWW